MHQVICYFFFLCLTQLCLAAAPAYYLLQPELRVLQENETVASFVTKEKIPLTALFSWNGKDHIGQFAPGDTLIVGFKSKKREMGMMVPRPGGKYVEMRAAIETRNPWVVYNNDTLRRKYHTVKMGEHLFQIAEKHNITIDQITEWNNLFFADQIFYGQSLVTGFERISKKPETMKEAEIWYQADAGQIEFKQEMNTTFASYCYSRFSALKTIWKMSDWYFQIGIMFLVLSLCLTISSLMWMEYLRRWWKKLP